MACAEALLGSRKRPVLNCFQKGRFQACLCVGRPSDGPGSAFTSKKGFFQSISFWGEGPAQRPSEGPGCALFSIVLEKSAPTKGSAQWPSAGQKAAFSKFFRKGLSKVLLCGVKGPAQRPSDGPGSALHVFLGKKGLHRGQLRSQKAPCSSVFL